MADKSTFADYAAPTRVVVACRPEDVRIEPRGEGARNRVPVLVQEQHYLGDGVEYSVSSARGRSLLVSSPRQERYRAGTALDLIIEPATATVWPA